MRNKQASSTIILRKLLTIHTKLRSTSGEEEVMEDELLWKKHSKSGFQYILAVLKILK